MSSIKLGYVVVTPELHPDETVTAYQGDTEPAFRTLRDFDYDGAELMIRDPVRLDSGMFGQLSGPYGIEIPVLRTGEVFGQDRLSFMDPDEEIRDQAVRRMRRSSTSPRRSALRSISEAYGDNFTRALRESIPSPGWTGRSGW